MKKRNILKGIIISVLSLSLTLSLTGCTGIGGVLGGALWQNPLNSGDDPFGLGQNTSGNEHDRPFFGQREAWLCHGTEAGRRG